MATIVDLTTAVLTAINANDFGVTFDAVKNYQPKVERKSMGDDWHVWLVPADLKATRAGRRRIRQEPSFDVGLIRRLPNIDADTVDPCLAFADAMQAFVATLTEVEGHDLTQNDFDPLYDPDRLKRQSVFLSVLTVTYRRHAA